jgi:hypothetical protein
LVQSPEAPVTVNVGSPGLAPVVLTVNEVVAVVPGAANVSELAPKVPDKPEPTGNVALNGRLDGCPVELDSTVALTMYPAELPSNTVWSAETLME